MPDMKVDTSLTRDVLLAKIVGRLVEAYRPERVYLFGSWARGDAGPTAITTCCWSYRILRTLPAAKVDSPTRSSGRRGEQPTSSFSRAATSRVASTSRPHSRQQSPERVDSSMPHDRKSPTGLGARSCHAPLPCDAA